jgi:hypothetical protein
VECTSAEVTAFTRDFEYFPTLLAAHDLPVEEVLAAHVRLAAKARDARGLAVESPYAFSVRAGQALARQLRGDHVRLSTVLQRIRQPRLVAPAASVSHVGEPLVQALVP